MTATRTCGRIYFYMFVKCLTDTSIKSDFININMIVIITISNLHPAGSLLIATSYYYLNVKNLEILHFHMGDSITRFSKFVVYSF